MKPEDAQRDRKALEIFGRAVEMPSAESRAGYLEGACGEDATLKVRVEALLANHVEDNFLQQPAAGLGPGTTAVVPITEKPGDRIGRYKLLQQIGEGGCGVVYMAEQEEPVRRRVALKVIKLGMDTKSVIARFEAERQALAMMDHPNIAKVLDAGATDTGRPYFVMELVRGVRVTEYCDENNLSTCERLDLFIKVCQAIQHAHQKGVIHRDIKPSNILVTINDDVPVPKVIDFGIAKATEQRLTEKTLFTEFQSFIGTPAYMSPEQAVMTSLDIDTRSDIYALGVLLYELLTGRTPFDAKELLAAGFDEMRRTLREKEPVRPSTRLSTMVQAELTATAKHRSVDAPRLAPLLRGDLDWIVMKCLEKDRTRRYETANGLAADIKRHLNNEPVVARPPSTAYRFQKAWRRNKLAFTAGAAVAVALVVGIAVSTWQAISATRARTEAVRAQTAEKEQQLAAQTAQNQAENAQQAEKQQRLRADQEKTEARRFRYVAQMNLAQQAWEQNNIGRLRQLLEETQDSPDRGFEWYYWQRVCHLARLTLRGHLGPVTSVAFSPDGHRVLSAGQDQTVRVWDAGSGRELLTLTGPQSRVTSVALSPDGNRIASGGADGKVKVWDATNGRELLNIKGATNPIEVLVFSPDSQQLVSGSWDNQVKVWDAGSGRELLARKGLYVGWSRDGVIDVREAAIKRVPLMRRGRTIAMEPVALSPDGLRIVKGGWFGPATVSETTSGRELITLEGPERNFASVAFSPDGKQVVSGGRGGLVNHGTVIVWDAATGRALLALKGHTEEVPSVAFSPDGQEVVSGSSDGTAKLWDLADGREPLIVKGHTEQIAAIAFAPDGHRIVTASADKLAKVWDTASGRELMCFKQHSDYVLSAAFSPDSQRIVTGSRDRTVKVWDATNGREILSVNGHHGAVEGVAFSPEGQRVASGSEDRTVKVWDAATGRELLTLEGNTDGILSVAFSADGEQIVAGSQDHTVKVWDAATGREVLTLKGHSGAVPSVAFFPDGRRIVSGSTDRTVKVWEKASGRELLTLKGHTDGVSWVAFSANGQRIASASLDGTVKVWESVSGREVLTLRGDGFGFGSMAFSADSRKIVTGCVDGTFRLWEAATPLQMAAWGQEEKAAAERLEGWRHEQAAAAGRRETLRRQDPGAIKQWLILAPITLATGQSGAEGLDIEQIEGENRLRPEPRETKSIGGGELKWREVALEDYVIDFNAILRHETILSVAYAVCYIQSEAAQRGLQMLVGSDDEAKVYLNGKQVYKAPVPRAFLADQDKVPDISLNVGLNVLVFKVANEAVDWKGSIRFTDAQGNPVKGIKVRLDPDARDSR